jgi:predicted DNA-binding transcriptional regulator AlpA
MNASMRPRQAAQYLGVSTATLWRWVKRAGFPQPLAIGPRVTVFKSDELRAWRDSHAVPDSAASPPAQSWNQMVESGAVCQWPLADADVPSHVAKDRDIHPMRRWRGPGQED